MVLFFLVAEKWNALKVIRRDWSKFTPKRKWLIFCNVGKNAGHMIGLRVQSDCKITIPTYITLILVVLYFGLVPYTIISGTMEGRFTESLSCLSMSGISASGAAAYVTSTVNRLEQKNISRAQIHRKISRIFQQIQKIDNFILQVSDVYYWYFFLSPFIFTYSIGIAVYSQYIFGFPPGYGLAVMQYVSMIVLCVMGQITVDRNDKLCDALYSELKWYLLPVEYQRDIGNIMNRLQNGACLTIGPFEPLSYEAAKVLTQRVHSFLMLLINFAK